MLERFAKQAKASCRRERAVIRLQFGHDRIVIFGVDDHADVLMIFRRGADHARPADVYVFNDFLEGRAARDRCLERIEIDDDEIDRHDTVLFHLGDMFGIISLREDSAVDFRMKRFNTAIHHFGKTGELRNVLHRYLIVAQ